MMLPLQLFVRHFQPLGEVESEERYKDAKNYTNY